MEGRERPDRLMDGATVTGYTTLSLARSLAAKFHRLDHHRPLESLRVAYRQVVLSDPPVTRPLMAWYRAAGATTAVKAADNRAGCAARCWNRDGNREAMWAMAWGDVSHVHSESSMEPALALDPTGATDKIPSRCRTSIAGRYKVSHRAICPAL